MGKRRAAARRSIVRSFQNFLLVAGIGLVLLGTAFLGYADYLNYRDDVAGTAQHVARFHQADLIQALSGGDAASMEESAALVLSPLITRAELRGAGGTFAAAGEGVPRFGQRAVIQIAAGDGRETLGELALFADAKPVILQSAKKLVTLLVFNILAVMGIVSVLSRMFKRQLAGHLNALAAHFQAMEADSPFAPLILDKIPRQDELDALVEAFNAMRDKLGRAYLEKVMALQSLAASKDDLRASRNLLTHVLDCVPMPIFWKDTGSVYLGCNALFAAMAGLPEPGVIAGKTDFDLPWQPGEALTYQAQDQEVIRGGCCVTFTGEFRFLPSGLKAVNVIKAPLRDPAGRVFGLLGVLEDVSEFKNALTQLRESQGRLATVTNAAMDAIVMMDGQGLATFWNPAAEKIFGYLGHEIIGRDIHEILAPGEGRAAFRQRFGEFSRHGTGPVVGKLVELTALHRDGSRLPIELTVAPIKAGESWHSVAVIRDISERKLAEAALRQREERLRAILRTAMDGFCLTDLQGRLLLVNEAYCRMSGYSEDELLAMNITGVEAMESAADIAERYHRIKQRGEERFESRHRRKDGSVFDVEVSLQYKDFDGGVTIAFMRDITGQKMAVAALRESEEKFRSLYESMAEGVAIHEVVRDGSGAAVDYRILDVNPSYVRLTGLDKSRAVGALATRLFGIGRPPYLDIYAAVAEGDQPVSFETYVPPLDKYLSISATSPGPGLFAIIFSDITERKRIRDELDKSLAELWNKRTELEQALAWKKAIVENPSLMLSVNNRERIIIEVTPGMCAYTGFTAEEVVGQSTQIFIAGEEGYEAIGAVYDRLDRGERVQFEIKLRRKHGEPFDALALGAKLSAGGEPGQYIWMFMDITDRKLDEQRAKERETQMLQADKMISMGIMASGIAHEINNPNNFIFINAPLLQNIWAGIVDVLDAHYRDNPEFSVGLIPYARMRDHVPNLIGGIIAGSTRIKNIVHDMKEFLSQKPGVQAESLDVNLICSLVLDLLSGKLSKATKALTVEYGPGLPRVRGNAQRLEQVVINLLINAAEALPDPSRGIKLATGYDARRRLVLITVTDEGAGIPADILPRIFDPFFTTKRETGGTGLGLAISRTIVKSHGGDLVFTSKPGKGTTARVELAAEPKKQDKEKRP